MTTINTAQPICAGVVYCLNKPLTEVGIGGIVLAVDSAFLKT